jgi:hypothetical protein
MRILDNPYIVIVTSSLHPSVGVISIKDRIEQTIYGIEAIRKKIPNCFIILSDVSVFPCDDAKQQIAGMVDVLADFSSNPFAIELSRSGLKSHGELLLMKYTLEWITQTFDVTNVKRIFKNSARHNITEEFNIDDYDNPEMIRKYVFKNSVNSWIKPDEWRLYESRLWSMDASQIDHYLSVWENMYNDCDGTVDMEHVLYKHLKPENSFEVPMIWVEGNVALNGKYQKD